MKNKGNIRQLDQEDCGPACLATIAAHYGLRLSVTFVREICGTSTEGTTLKGLRDGALHLGFEADAFRAPTPNLLELKHIPLPGILHVRRPDGWLHYVVLVKTGKTSVTIYDPADGHTHRVRSEELSQQWSGYLLLLAPGHGFHPGNHRTSWWQRMRSLLLQHRREWMPALWGSIAYAMASFTTSLFLKIILDQVLPNQEFSLHFFIGSIMLVMVILSLITAFLRSMFVVRSGILMDGGLVLSYIRHLFGQPLPFFLQRSSGELNARIGDIFRIRAFVSGRLLILLISLLNLLLSFTLLIHFCWDLALISFAFIPGYILLYALAYRAYRRINRESIESGAHFESTCVEMFARFRIAKWFCAENTFIQKIEHAYTRFVEKLYRSGRTTVFYNTCTEGLAKLQTWTTVIIGSYYVLENQLSVGELVSFYAAIGFFTSPIISWIESGQALSEAKIASDRVFEILELPQETSPMDPADERWKEWLHFSEIRLQHIDFAYPGNLPLFLQFSCSFPRGKITAIRGQSGCGKSTLASLLLRTHPPDRGKILLDEADSAWIPLSEWRSICSIVPQQAELFPGSIAENIAPHTRKPDLLKVQQLCQWVGLQDLLDQLPDNLQTQIGTGGRMLSGGECQKIALARALYRNPTVLILDEATAHLDPPSRKAWYKLLKGLAGEGKCIILISHDEEGNSIADCSLNLEKLMRISEGGRPRT